MSCSTSHQQPLHNPPDIGVLILVQLARHSVLHDIQQHWVKPRQRVLLAALALAVRGLLLAWVAAQTEGETLGCLRERHHGRHHRGTHRWKSVAQTVTMLPAGLCTARNSLASGC
jgi:hypothetical protein